MLSPATQSRSSHTSISRASISGSALRRGDLKISDPMPLSGQLTVGDQPSMESSTSIRPMDGAWPRKATPPATNIRTDSVGHREASDPLPISYNDLNRMSMGPSIIQSSMSTVPSKTSLNQRNTRGFRATIRRLFGSKRHTTSFSESQRDYYRGDPGNLTSIVEKQPIDHILARTPSQPVRTVTRSSALRSHSPFATLEDLKESKWRAPDEWKSIRSRHKRRNTLPSVILSQQEAQMIANALRPIDTRHDADMETYMSTRADDTSKTLKRLSRSADALRELAESHQVSQTDPRRRSGEIAYWRTSVIDNPLPDYGNVQSSNSPTNLYGSPSTNPTSPHRTNPSQSTMSPLQAFDFGLAGANDSTCLEERVSTLEVKVVDFEYAIAKLQGQEIPRPARMPKRRSVHELFPNTRSQASNSSMRSRQTPPTTQATSKSASSHDLTYTSSLLHSSSPFGAEPDSTQTDRSSRATTIRPSTAIRISPQHSAASPLTSVRLDAHHFEMVLAMVQDEQAARHRLESHVQELRKEIDELRAPVYAYIRPAPMPTPSPESPKVRALHRTPAFPEHQRINPHETSRFSMTDGEDDEEAESDTDDGSLDVYETPRETRFTFSSDASRSNKSSPLVEARNLPQIGLL